MPDPAQFLAVHAVEPKLDTENVGQAPDIQVRFNIPVDAAYVNTDEQLNQHAILIREDTEHSVPLTFVSWDAATRILVFRPAEPLDWGARYQTTLLRSLRNYQGRGMQQDRTWVFQVGQSAVPAVELQTPGDSTAFTASPQLVWSGVVLDPVEAVTYDVQLAETREFFTVLWSTQVTDPAPASGVTQQAAIGIALTAGRNHYWRVRARTATLTGAWSEVRVFFLGTPAKAQPDPVFLYQLPPTLQLLGTTIPESAGNVQAWPEIAFSFTLPLDTAATDVVRVVREPVDGRVREPAVPLLGPGTDPAAAWEVAIAGSTVTVTPAGDLLKNTRYRLTVRRELASTDGAATLGEDLVCAFTGPYAPIYGGTLSVRSSLGGFISQVDEDDVLFHMWRSSVEINNLLLRQLNRTWQRAARPITQETLDEVIAFQPQKVTYGMDAWVEANTALVLLEGYYYDLLSEAGRQTVLGPFQHKVDVALLAELREKIKELKAECEQLAAQFLAALVVPRTVIQGQFWDSESQLARDWSYDGPDDSEGFRRSSF